MLNWHLEGRPTHAEDPGSLLKLTDHFEVQWSWDHLFGEELGENFQNCHQKITFLLKRAPHDDNNNKIQVNLALAIV